MPISRRSRRSRPEAKSRAPVGRGRTVETTSPEPSRTVSALSDRPCLGPSSCASPSTSYEGDPGSDPPSTDARWRSLRRSVRPARLAGGRAPRQSLSGTLATARRQDRKHVGGRPVAETERVSRGRRTDRCAQWPARTPRRTGSRLGPGECRPRTARVPRGRRELAEACERAEAAQARAEAASVPRASSWPR